jgi:hypothetical protein
LSSLRLPFSQMTHADVTHFLPTRPPHITSPPLTAIALGHQ